VSEVDGAAVQLTVANSALTLFEMPWDEIGGWAVDEYLSEL
jgi:hypothetical protein